MLLPMTVIHRTYSTVSMQQSFCTSGRSRGSYRPIRRFLTAAAAIILQAAATTTLSDIFLVYIANSFSAYISVTWLLCVTPIRSILSIRRATKSTSTRSPVESTKSTTQCPQFDIMLHRNVTNDHILNSLFVLLSCTNKTRSSINIWRLQSLLSQ